MAKPGRNDPCPCGSGNKYKKCCLPKEEAEKRAALADEQANREEGTMARRFDVHYLKEALAERLARTGHDDEDDEID